MSLSRPYRTRLHCPDTVLGRGPVARAREPKRAQPKRSRRKDFIVVASPTGYRSRLGVSQEHTLYSKGSSISILTLPNKNGNFKLLLFGKWKVLAVQARAQIFWIGKVEYAGGFRENERKQP